jgi:hypothetical protein
MAAATLPADAAESVTVQEARARTLVEGLSAVFQAPAFEGAIVSRVRLVAQKPGQLWGDSLPPVWVADLRTPRGTRGHLMWDDGAGGRLVEFALDEPVTPIPSHGGVLGGLRGIQQFPVPGKDGRKVASGCVPTAAGILINFWSQNRFSRWAGDAPKDGREGTEALSYRIRKRLKMTEIPDTTGYTDDGMTLSGALPAALKEVISQDAAEQGVYVRTEYRRYSAELLREEISSGRPVLLDCLVRLPHKPELSWGHEITGVGWLEWEGVRFAGVRDNFFPTRSEEATRWIREEAFGGILTVHPREPR